LCAETLDWTNFQIDHIKAHSRGGKTDLRNAALTCVTCNASKGARRRARRKSA
jgi:5-methylcytosine-specific restriction endonuclease McrA